MSLKDKLHGGTPRPKKQEKEPEPDRLVLSIPKFPGRKDIQTPKPYCKRDPKTGQILPGSTPNPYGGRPAYIARGIAEATGVGEEMWAFQLMVMRGDIEIEVVTAKGDVVTVGPTIKERQAAAEYLTERMAGKAPAIVAIGSADGDGPSTENVLAKATPALRRKALELFAELHGPKKELEEKQIDTVEGVVTPAP